MITITDQHQAATVIDELKLLYWDADISQPHRREYLLMRAGEKARQLVDMIVVAP